MENKRFDDWRDELKNCNDCELYWLNTCDGVSQGDERICKAYKVTRNLSIPKKLNDLENTLRNLIIAQTLLNVLFVIYILYKYFEGVIT